MSDRTSSRTALATAYLRAVYQLLDNEPRVLDNPVAVSLLGKEAPQIRVALTGPKSCLETAKRKNNH
jgi:hypothetical protein